MGEAIAPSMNEDIPPKLPITVIETANALFKGNFTFLNSKSQSKKNIIIKSL